MKWNVLLLALSGLSFTASPYAAMVSKDTDKDSPICSSTLCAFNNPGGLYLSGTGYYVLPSETGLGLVTDSWLFTTSSGPSAQSTPFDPSYKWAGGFSVGYDIPTSANNIEFNYLRLRNDTHAVNSFSNGATSFASILFPDAIIPAGAIANFVSDAKLHYTVNQYDVKVGRKYSETSGVFYLKPSIGVRYAQIKHNLTFIQPGQVESNYSGTGPMFSLDGHYAFNHGFGLLGYFDYALMSGNMSADSYVVLGQKYSFSWPNRNRVVNNVTGKIGLDYTHALTNSATWTVAAGYQINEYFSAMDTIRGITNAGGAGILGAQRVFGCESNNFSFQGLFITLSAHA